jgi:hypothetical protein
MPKSLCSGVPFFAPREERAQSQQKCENNDGLHERSEIQQQEPIDVHQSVNGWEGCQEFERSCDKKVDKERQGAASRLFRHFLLTP